MVIFDKLHPCVMIKDVNISLRTFFFFQERFGESRDIKSDALIVTSLSQVYSVHILP